MKRFIFTALASAAVIASMYQLSPYKQDQKILQATAALASKTNVYDAVTLRGSVVELGRSRVCADGPAQVLEVYVQVGNSVKQGELLARLQTVRSEAGAVFSDVNQLLDQLAISDLQGMSEQQSQDLAAVFSAAVGGASNSGDQQAAEEIYDLIAPTDGIVMELNVAMGDTISGALPCVVISDMGQLAIKAQVSEANVGKIAEGMECTVTVEALNRKDLPGSVEAVYPYAKQTGGLLDQGTTVKTDVLMALTQKDESLRPGYSATAKIITSQKSGALLVPYTSVAQDEDNREYVMVAREGRAIKQYVETGYELEKQIEISAGIGENDLVIDHPENLQHGCRVQLTVEAES